MKQLLIDSGNTAVKYRTLSSHGEINKVDREKLASSLAECSSVYIASVKDHEESSIVLNEFKKVNKPIVKLSTEKLAFGVTCAYGTPSNLGIDRWLAVLAAHNKWPNSAVVIADLGTAATIDAVTADGQHLGGWIMPGVSLQQESIVSKAPGVFNKNATELNKGFGNDTPAALQGGVTHSIAGAIVLATKQLNIANCDVKVVLTGGDADLISRFLDLECEIIPDLVFEGMALFAKNTSQK